MCLAVTAEQAL